MCTEKKFGNEYLLDFSEIYSSSQKNDKKFFVIS